MSNLDDKLLALEFESMYEFNVQTKKDIIWKLDEAAVAQIKQAFADEGYDTFRSKATFGEPLMSGQEWYDRFDRGLEAVSRLDKELYDQVIFVAKKAAGL